MRYYRNTFVVLVLLFLAAAGTYVFAALWTVEERANFTAAVRSASVASDQRQTAESEQSSREQKVRVLREFAKTWDAHSRPAAAKDLGNVLRNGLTTLATRAGLTSESATVAAEPRSYALAGRGIKVQQVSLNVLGESLPAVVTWLGAAEAQFAYARVESLTLSGYASHSVQISVTLLHPVEEGLGREVNAVMTSGVSRL